MRTAYSPKGGTRVTHRETGEALDTAFAHVFTTKGDRITNYQQYTDTYQWRRLAGTLDEK